MMQVQNLVQGKHMSTRCKDGLAVRPFGKPLGDEPPLSGKKADSPSIGGHELLNPLTAIINNAEALLLLISANNPDTDEITAAIEDIRSEAWRLTEIIRTHIDLFRRTDG
jgi:hypothetical protein